LSHNPFFFFFFFDKEKCFLGGRVLILPFLQSLFPKREDFQVKQAPHPPHPFCPVWFFLSPPGLGTTLIRAPRARLTRWGESQNAYNVSFPTVKTISGGLWWWSFCLERCTFFIAHPPVPTGFFFPPQNCLYQRKLPKKGVWRGPVYYFSPTPPNPPPQIWVKKKHILFPPVLRRAWGRFSSCVYGLVWFPLFFKKEVF